MSWIPMVSRPVECKAILLLVDRDPLYRNYLHGGVAIGMVLMKLVSTLAR